jgi:hypothetical protein
MATRHTRQKSRGDGKSQGETTRCR